MAERPVPEGGVRADLIWVRGVILGLEGGQGPPRFLGGSRGIQVGTGQLRVAGIIILATSSFGIQAATLPMITVRQLKYVFLCINFSFYP